MNKKQLYTFLLLAFAISAVSPLKSASSSSSSSSSSRPDASKDQLRNLGTIAMGFANGKGAGGLNPVIAVEIVAAVKPSQRGQLEALEGIKGQVDKNTGNKFDEMLASVDKFNASLKDQPAQNTLRFLLVDASQPGQKALQLPGSQQILKDAAKGAAA